MKRARQHHPGSVHDIARPRRRHRELRIKRILRRRGPRHCHRGSTKQCEPGQRGNVAAPQSIPRIRRTTRRGTPPARAHRVRTLQRIFHAPAHQHARRPQARAHGVGRRAARHVNRILHRQYRAAAAQKLRDKPHAHRDHERNHRCGIAQQREHLVVFEHRRRGLKPQHARHKQPAHAQAVYHALQIHRAHANTEQLRRARGAKQRIEHRDDQNHRQLPAERAQRAGSPTRRKSIRQPARK